MVIRESFYKTFANMKRSLPLLLIAVGCGSSGSVIRGQSEAVVITTGGAPLYRRDSAAVIGSQPFGDTVLTYGYSWDPWSMTGNKRYLVLSGVDTVLVRAEDVRELWELQPTTFTLPAAQDKDAWARANYYVNTYADLKVQTANEFLVETFNATRLASGTSFSVNRLPQGNQVQFTVNSNNPTAGRKCAYYIATGKLVK